jgi:hypothetical protein
MVEKFEGNPLQRDADGQDSYDMLLGLLMLWI